MFRSRPGLITLALRSLVLRGNPIEHWPASLFWLIWLTVLSLSAEIAVLIWWRGYPGEINVFALPAALMPLLWLLLVGQWFGPREQRWAQRLPVMWMALSLLLLPLWVGGYELLRQPWWDGRAAQLWRYRLSWTLVLLPYCWLGLALLRQLWRSGRLRALVTTLIAVGGLVGFQLYYPESPLWLADAQDTQDVAEPVAPTPPLPETALFFRQPELLHQALNQLTPEVPGAVDVYTIAVAGFGGQTVFLREAEAARQRFADPHGGRDVLLANAAASADRRPMASRDTLAATIREVGRLMNPAEDMLVLYLTSHGGEDHAFSLSYPELELAPITPQWLAETLKSAGIRWKLVAVSACYSGGYLKPLADPYSAVVTAADAKHTSFGCSDNEEYTYFGRAFIVDALGKEARLQPAFNAAKAAILKREAAEEYEHSNPQLALGAEFARRFPVLPLRRGPLAPAER
ncbi:C13 family peptidase [Chitinolyticbacter albus]|uniref:C13 family peptidase n=1 Tax=Chitinolyticbacter albus TaxID=2961951 RepID=UPI00210BD828|nr:C13 family peptidase [Chitinolyticbacter albus]